MTINFSISQNILIVSEPRSGSHWFQSCLNNHYSLGELFNVTNIESIRLGPERAQASGYMERELSSGEERRLLTERFSLFEASPKPCSIKVHSFQLHKFLRDWIDGQDFYIFQLLRRDRLAALRSLLIANHTKKFSGVLEKETIQVDCKNFQQSIQALSPSHDILAEIDTPVHRLYYEDLLQLPEQPGFSPSQSWMRRQHSAEKVHIENWSQVLEWLNLQESAAKN